MITPRRDSWVLGDFDAETFLDCVNSLERVEDELELRQVVVEPQRTMFDAAKEVLQEPFCTEIGVSFSGQKELVCSWKCIRMNIVPVHGKSVYQKGLIDQNWEHLKWKSDWNVSQTDTDWNVWTFGNWIRSQFIQFPPCLTVCQYVSAKSLNLFGIWWILTTIWCLVSIGGYSVPLRIGLDNMFLLAYWYMIPLLCCR